jgi:quinol monooxygenase YgiN
MIVVAVRIQVKPQMREQFMQLAQGMLAPSRAEPGCISYNFFADTVEPNAFLFFEEWESREVLAAHTKTAHFLTYSPRAAECMDSRSLRVYDVASSSDD